MMSLQKMQSHGPADRRCGGDLIPAAANAAISTSGSTGTGWSLVAWIRNLRQRLRSHAAGDRHRLFGRFSGFGRFGARRCKASDEGAVTAEFAVVLPAVMVMAVLLMMLARAVTVEMNCQDAASAAARVAVVSNSDTEARLAAHDAAGGDANVSISRGFKQVKVTVSCRVVPDPMHVLPMAVVGKATGVVQ
ncbi:pilus assembly protein [Bifidobacterium sp. ESL0690]|uniref:TadE family type IV pilus minor pilin n=1 Tax=Bifidobacterium sp. ESL0690 TaxID=2983214 RepID=UPI0023F6E17F|nr:TadE family type IV pilus minor pilin [Bifidobacterium sp. ESL0690]WEV46410.1 pilus assembly protein [Bifidobacterium sp. ESL0690]